MTTEAGGMSWAADPDEHLATGWERDLPSDDTLVRAFFDAFAGMAEAVARGVGGKVMQDERFTAVDCGSPNAYLNAAVLLAPVLDRDDPVLARLVDFYSSGRGGPWILVAPALTPDLRPFGLEPVGHPPLMFRPAGGNPRSRPADLEILEVRDQATLHRFERACIDFYPFPDMASAVEESFFPAAILDDPGFRLWLGLVDGRPVGTSAVHTGEGVTHVEYVTSSPGRRGRGYGEAMTWVATLAEAERPSLLITSDDGQPTYKRMGYVALARVTMWAGPRRT